jgi:hypothetical protein
MVPAVTATTNTLDFNNTLASTTANTLASTATLQDEQVLQAAAALQTSWPAKLTFSLLGSASPTDNLLDYTRTIWRGQKFYFCPIKYPANDDGFHSMRRDIQVAALANGSNFVSNGSRNASAKSGNAARVYSFVCSRVKKPSYVPCSKRRMVDNKTSLRNTTTTSQHNDNDRRNSRGSSVGPSMSRRTSTTTTTTASSSMDAKKHCSCKFQLGRDNFGYYFCGGIGNFTHNFHDRILHNDDTQIKLPARLINNNSQQEKAILQTSRIGMAFSNNEAGDNDKAGGIAFPDDGIRRFVEPKECLPYQRLEPLVKEIAGILDDDDDDVDDDDDDLGRCEQLLEDFIVTMKRKRHAVLLKKQEGKKKESAGSFISSYVPTGKKRRVYLTKHK